MPVNVGDRFGHYDVTALLGEGGMGRVYRATDTRLRRAVALKILPEAFLNDNDRVVRFEREAHVLASLNHPNIAAIYGLESPAGAGRHEQALVLELVEGPTLADRLGQGPIPVHEALPIARQIAEALEAAHDAGVIHRDLKPANVKLRPDGTVKVLDFGLAKAVAPGPSSTADGLSQSPTITSPAMTRAGVILGTAAYMSPEQARGQPVDKRLDIWAFGCLFYEMLTGRAAFARGTASDTLAAVLGSEPEWDALPDTTPLAVRRVLHRCLEKDTRKRLHDIADARIELEDALESRSPQASLPAEGLRPLAPRARVRRYLAVGIGAIVLVVAGWTVRNFTEPTLATSNGPPIRFAIHLTPGQQFPIDSGSPAFVAISPDGGQIVYAARQVGVDRLYRRRLGEFEASPVPGTEGATGPFFSPGGQWIGFASGGMLRAVPALGGPPRTLAASPYLTGASWGPDGTVVFGNWGLGLQRVSAAGGTPEPLTELDDSQGETLHSSPHVLPSGTAALFTSRSRREQFVEAVDFTTRTRQRLIEGRNPTYIATGHIVFARGTALYAVPFDIVRREITGSAIHLLDGVGTDGSDSHFAIARDASLVYVPVESRNSRLVWFRRDGSSRPLDDEPRPYAHPRISPDGAWVVVTTTRESGGQAIWIYDAGRGTRAPLTPSGSRPIWTADGTRITFQMDRHLYSVPRDDSRGPELVLERDDRSIALHPLDWSHDGRVLMYSAGATNRDVWTLSADGSPTPFLVTPRDERAAMFSPDARWMVYAAKEIGREEQVYVQPYPGPGGRIVISPGGGIQPVWSPTGREIFYLSVDGTRLMSVDVRTEPTLTVETPRLVFPGRFVQSSGYWSNYDVSRDGQEFLMLEAEQASSPLLNVVLNWTDVLK